MPRRGAKAKPIAEPAKVEKSTRPKRAARPSRRKQEADEDRDDVDEKVAVVEEEVEEEAIVPAKKKRAVGKRAPKKTKVKKEEEEEEVKVEEVVEVQEKKRKAPAIKKKAPVKNKPVKKEEEEEEVEEVVEVQEKKRKAPVVKKKAPVKKKPVKKEEDDDDEYDEEDEVPHAVAVGGDDDDESIVDAATSDDELSDDDDGGGGEKQTKKKKAPLSGKKRKESGSIEAEIKAIKARNARGRKPIPSNDARGLDAKFRHVRGNNLGPTAKSLGIPYERALVGFNKVGWRYFPDFSGIIIWREDFDDLQTGLNFRNRKRNLEADRARERAEKMAQERAQQAERALERTNSLAGAYTSPEFVKALTAAGTPDGALLATAVKRVVGKAAADMGSADEQLAAAAGERVAKGIEDVKARAGQLLELLGRVDVAALDEAAIVGELRNQVLAALDGSGDAQSTVAPLASLVRAQSKQAVSWRTKLAALCTPVVYLPSALASVGLTKAALEDALANDENRAFDYDAAHGYVSIVGAPAEKTGVARRLHMFDRALLERGVVGLSPALQHERALIAGGRERRMADLRSKLVDMTLPQLRDEARDRGASLRGASRKDDIIEAIVAHVCDEADPDAELEQLLAGRQVAAEVAGHAQIRAVLEPRGALALHSRAAAAWHERRLASGHAAAVAVLAEERVQRFDALGKREAVVLAWDLSSTQSTIVADARRELADPARIEASTETVAEVVAAVGKRVTAELVAWVEQSEKNVALHKQRKQTLDAKLAAVGYRREPPFFSFSSNNSTPVELDTRVNHKTGVVGKAINGTDYYLQGNRVVHYAAGQNKAVDANQWAKAFAPQELWSAMLPDNRTLPLAWPQRLVSDDTAVLNGAIVDLAKPLTVPPRLLIRAARRATLLDALRRWGVAADRIPASASNSQPLVFEFLNGATWPTPRAAAAALVGQVRDAKRRDIFAALPLHVIFELCDFMLKNHVAEMINLVKASTAFGLGAAVWAVDRAQVAVNVVAHVQHHQHHHWRR